jgi:hypothetical protein
MRVFIELRGAEMTETISLVDHAVHAPYERGPSNAKLSCHVFHACEQRSNGQADSRCKISAPILITQML